MSRTLALLRIAFQHSLAYRSEIVVWMILDMVPTVILFVVWEIIFRDGQVHQGYTFSQMMEYSMYLLLINAITAVHFEGHRVQQIREGKVDVLLLRPVSYLRQIFIEHLGGRIFYLLLFIPLFVVIQQILGTWYHLTFSPWTPQILLSVCALLLFGSIMEFGFGMVVVLFGFWFEYSEGLEHFKWIVITLLSGAMLPVVFLPPWLRQVVEVLPFRYMYAEVINTIQSRSSLQLSDIIIMFVTVIFWVLGMQLLWQAARKRYASGGG